MTKEIRDETVLDQIRTLNRCDRLLFEHWFDVHARELLDKWLEENMYKENTFHSDGFAHYLINNFVEWVNHKT